jgi:hypothetical protein
MATVAMEDGEGTICPTDRKASTTDWLDWTCWTVGVHWLGGVVEVGVELEEDPPQAARRATREAARTSGARFGVRVVMGVLLLISYLY